MFRLILNIWLFLLFSSKVVFPQFSPGDLSKAHAHLEGLDNCTQCHDLGKKINGGKCLQCHVLIKTRIDHNIGFHSSSQVRNKECIQCHTEHRGYGFDMIKWESGRSGFDHVQTGYLLEGKHKTAKCESCHKPEHIKDAAVRSRTNDDRYLSKTFLGLTQQCGNCHFDEHRNHLSQLCIKCHDFENWKTSAEQKFDHSATRFPLTGKHSLAACLQCHPLTLDSKQKPGGGVDLDYLKFTNIKFDKCTACHTDPHNNAFGQKCEKCHVPGGWQNVIISGFDHSKTNFPLTGKHLVVNCEKCHQPDIRKKAAYKNIKHDECRDCHTDIHAGQFAERADKGKCESCHNTKGFIPSQYSITRHNQIKFQLTGAHAAVTCIQCHVTLSPSEFILKIGTSIKPADSTTVFRFASLACASCHADIHKEQFKEKIDRTGCESCHKADSWSALIFDHNKDSKFPLNNKHAGIACSKCHLPDPEYAPYLKYKGTSSLCESCHFDVHFGQFAQYQELGSDHPITLCDRCHSDAGFKHLNFDHSAKSRFTLTGAHEKVACSKCHRAVTLNNGMTTIVYKPIEIKCSSCHANLE